MVNQGSTVMSVVRWAAPLRSDTPDSLKDDRRRSKLVDDVESAANGFDLLFIIPDVSWMVIGGDNDPHWSNSGGGALNFSREWVMVSPDFKVVSQTFVLLREVVEKDVVLTLVAVPPLVKRLNEEVFLIVLIADGLGLADSWCTPDPFILQPT